MRTLANRVRGLAYSQDTSREVLLALSELARRRGGDRPQVSEDEPLTAFELRVFSQNGEDGVLAELLRRSGEGGRFFVEFGAGAGTQNNTAYLADVVGWSGLYLEQDAARAEALRARYTATPVTVAQAAVGPDTVDETFAEAGVPAELDVLSIDVDGQDYWIWRGLERFRPRIVIIEYNASLGPERVCVEPEGTVGSSDQTDYGGASIAALRELGEAKGYRLVHTEVTGNNAFFLRVDQPGTYPAPELVPLRPVNHFLIGIGHPPDRTGRSYVRP